MTSPMPVPTTPVSSTYISVEKAKITKKIDKVGLEMHDLNKLLQPLNSKVMTLVQKLRGLKKDQKKLDKSLVAATDSQSSGSDSGSDSDSDIADEKTTMELECDKKIQAMQIMHKNELDAMRALMTEQLESYIKHNYSLIATITHQESQIKTLKLKNQASVGSKTLPVMKNNTSQLKPNSATFTPVKPVATSKDVDKGYDYNKIIINDAATNAANTVFQAVQSAHSLNELNRNLGYGLIDARSKLSNPIGPTTNNINKDNIVKLTIVNTKINELEEKLRVANKKISKLTAEELTRASEHKLALTEKHNEILSLQDKLTDHTKKDMDRQRKNPSSSKSTDSSASSASSSDSSSSGENVTVNMHESNSASNAADTKKSRSASSNNTQDSGNVNLYDNTATADYSNVGVDKKLYNIVASTDLKADIIKNDSRMPLTTGLPQNYLTLAIPRTINFT